MLFNTIEFILFLPVVVLLYYLTPSKYRWFLLLSASYYFYMCWKLDYILLIIASTITDYICGIMMSNISVRKKRIPWLLLSLGVNLGLLFYFKYFNFFSDSYNYLIRGSANLEQLEYIDLLLPVGISFYTFQTLSYSIDIYFDRIKAETHIGYFALYVSFFPQLVAGPIERFDSLNPQFKEKHKLTYENLANGLRLIIYGLFIKMVIADNLSPFVDKIYQDPGKYEFFTLLKGVFAYSYQIYSDFYGYSIVAIGSAMILGIKLMDNFRTPYLAKGIGEFWQRWHISLSTWFRDYLYFPLGGNRVSKIRWAINIMIVFLVSGLWHGANWTFIFWGGLYGVVYLIEHLLNKQLKIKSEAKPWSARHILLAIKTFIIVSFIWVFFRSQDLGSSLLYFEELMQFNFSKEVLDLKFVTLFFVLLFILSDILFYNNRIDKWLQSKHWLLRWGVYSILLFSIIVFSGVENFPFIYFQF